MICLGPQTKKKYILKHFKANSYRCDKYRHVQGLKGINSYHKAEREQSVLKIENYFRLKETVYIDIKALDYDFSKLFIELKGTERLG